MTNSSGYVAKSLNDEYMVGIDLGLSFLKDPETKREKIFASREEALQHFRDVELWTDQEIATLFWFVEGEDRKRSLLTGELLVPPLPPDWLPEDDILPQEEDDDD